MQVNCNKTQYVICINKIPVQLNNLNGNQSSDNRNKHRLWFNNCEITS